jgi:hypothetical protein
MRALLVVTPLVVPAALLAAALLSAGARADEAAPAAASLTPPAHAAPDLSASDPQAFRCDGTDEAFFAEMKQAGRVGYGETWDEHVCDQGVEVYGEGANSRWSAWKKRTRPRATEEDQALALVLPLVSFGGLGAVALAAAALAFAQRMRRLPVLNVACPSCDAELPVAQEQGKLQHMFCPMCGAPCSVHIEGKGKTASARARA